MKRLVLSIIILLFTAGMTKAANTDPVTELEKKISSNLENGKWDSSSKAFLVAIWNEYKQAHFNTIKNNITKSISGKMPDIKDYNDYVGNFTREPGSIRPFIEIEKDAQGRFYINLEEHKIPSVLTNKCVICTTGDIVYSRIPQFGQNPYCTLEMLMVIHTDGKFYMASPESSSDQWMEITKIGANTENTQTGTEGISTSPGEEKNWKQEYEKLYVVNQNLEGQLLAQKQKIQELQMVLNQNQITITELQRRLQK